MCIRDSFWRCLPSILYTQVSRIRCYQGYWRQFFYNYKTIYWLWISQEIQWCSREYYLQSRREATSILLYWIWYRESYIQSSRGRNRYSSSWRSGCCMGSILLRKWKNSYYWNCRYRQNESILWIWFTQEILWCCREYYIQSRRETTSILLYRNGIRKYIRYSSRR